MNPRLTDEMREALRDTAGNPVMIEDDLTHEEYVLVPMSVYQRFAALVPNERLDVEDTYAAQSAAAGAAGWDDPDMDMYDDYDAHRPRT